MVGEIREPEAAVQAVIAGIQGHVVLATMHSRDAASAITRLRNFGLKNHQIAAALGVVVNQRLVRKLCQHCLDLSEASQESVDYFESRNKAAPERVGMPCGCEKCDGTGYHGLTSLFEVWNFGEKDYRSVLRGDDEEELRRGMKEVGHRNLLDDAATKTQEGIISFDDIRRAGLDLPWRNY
jgi:type II secretory ATPase GspE/PulE/Tfp pilus assembly ATPase PilB-like protein